MALINCPECRQSVSDKTDKCPHCGYPIYMNRVMNTKKVRCEFCDSINDGLSSTCTHCGATLNIPLDPPPTNTFSNFSADKIQQTITDTIHSNNFENIITPMQGKARNKWISVCLCIFLGYLGGHRFYEGKYKTAILYVFTIGLFGIGWLIDLCILLGKPNTYIP